MDCTIYVAKNKGPDQLRGYRKADLRLCFRICKSRFSHNKAHMPDDNVQSPQCELIHI